MEIINGFTIVASLPQRDGLRMILAARETHDGGREYVTAQARNEATDEWWWGHYFLAGLNDQGDVLARALADLSDRHR